MNIRKLWKNIFNVRERHFNPNDLVEVCDASGNTYVGKLQEYTPNTIVIYNRFDAKKVKMRKI